MSSATRWRRLASRRDRSYYRAVSSPTSSPLMDWRAQLQNALGSAYTIQRELGGGGMSRVFLAEETALGRRVVIKVLPADLTAGVNVDRFNREVHLAASLQQAQIVPVLTAGQVGGVPFY